MKMTPEDYDALVDLPLSLGGKSIWAYIRKYPELVTPELPEAMVRWADAAARAEDMQPAARAYYEASEVWRHLGDHEQTLLQQVKYLDCKFMLVKDPEFVGRDAHRQLREARRLKLLDIAFRLATLEADCIFFAARAKGDNESEKYCWIRY